MTIVRVGSNHKYAEGWEAAFTKGKKNAAKPTPAKAGKKTSAKKKAAGKKKAKKK